MNASTRHDALPVESARPDWASPQTVVLSAGAAAVAAFAVTGGAVVAEAPQLLLVGVAGVALVIALLQPTVALLGMVVIVYSNAAAVAVTFHGAPALLAAAVPLLLLIPALHNAVRLSPVLTSTMPWLLALLLVHMVSALVSGNLGNSMEGIVAFGIEGILLFVLVVNSIRQHEMMRRVVWALVLTGGSLGMLSGLQQLTDSYYRSYLGFAQVGDGAVRSETSEGEEVTQPRLAGPIGEKNYYAQYWLMLVPLGGYLVVSERRRLHRVAAGAATAMVLVGIAATYSRGAAVGILVMVIALAALGHIRLRHLGLVAVAIALLMILLPTYVGRVTRITEVVTAEGEVDEAVAGRVGENTAAVLAFFDHPVIGVGPGQFRLHYEQYARAIGADQHTGTRRAHSLYLSTAAELGIIGLVVMLGVLGSTMRALWRSRRYWLRLDPARAQMQTAFLLSLVSFMATAAFLDLAYARYFWLMLGVAAAAAHIGSPPRSGVARNTARVTTPSPSQR